MANIKIAFINESSVVTDKEVIKVMKAMQTQVNRDFAKYWGVKADLAFYTSKKRAPKDSWWLVFFNHPDEADAYGYHDLTSEGFPLGKVFPKLDIDEGNAWSTTVSHEVLEMLGDPSVNLMVNRFSGPKGNILYAYEVCDPCQDPRYSYKINGVEVSDFVTPDWFEQIEHPKGTKFDHLGKIKKPFELLPGGYISICSLRNNKGWVQVDAPQKHYKMKIRKGSRRARRKTDPEQWKRSEK